MKIRNIFLISLIWVLFNISAYSQITSNPFCVNGATYESTELGFGSFRHHVSWFNFDSAGMQIIRTVTNIYGNELIINIKNFPNGCYSMIISEDNSYFGYKKFIKN